MSQATAVKIQSGRVDPTIVYAVIKNGNVYQFNSRVPADKIATFAQRIAAAGNKIKLKHWTLARVKGTDGYPSNPYGSSLVGTSPEGVCSRCMGSPTMFKNYMHINAGLCFKCNGSGRA